MFRLLITVSFSKANLLIKDKLSKFFDSHLFYIVEYDQIIHYYIIEKQKSKKMVLYGWTNSVEKWK